MTSKSLFSISFLIIAGVLFFTVVSPLYGGVSKLKGEVNTYNLALKNSTELQRVRDSLIDVYKNIRQEDKDRLEHFLPNSVNNIQLILEVEKIAGLHGMPIKNIKFEGQNLVNPTQEEKVLVAIDGVTENLPYGIFPLEFSVDGRYSDFVSFLKDIEYNLRLVDIKSISFKVPSVSNKVDGTAGSNIYSYTLKAEIYWLK